MSAQAAELKRLAQAAKFETLSKAENLLLEKAPTGEPAICAPGHDAKVFDPRDADNWSPARRVRAQLVAWLCTTEQAKKLIDPRGIQLYGAEIVGPLDLSFASIPFQLGLQFCRLRETIKLHKTEISQFDLQGSLANEISADDLVVHYDVLLRHGFSALGEVRFAGARIGGNFDCIDGSFTAPSERGAPLVADRINVGRSIFFRHSTVNGELRILGAQVGGDLDFSFGTLNNPPRIGTPGTGRALSADAIDVKGSVLFRGSAVNGGAEMVNARIGNNLDCDNAAFINPTQDGDPGNGIALNAGSAMVGNSVLLNGRFEAVGKVMLQGIQVRVGIACQGANFQQAALHLTDASAGFFFDTGLNDVGSPDVHPTIWPQPGSLFLDGFVYGRISSDGQINVANRLGWVARQPRSPFHPRPYLQLAKVLRESGDDDGATQVLMAMEDGLRKGDFSRPILKWTVGYGYHPLWAFWSASFLTAVGWIVYRRSYLAGGIVPTDKDACSDFKNPGAQIRACYPSFSPLVYSVENSLPLVKLGQADKWQPNPEPDGFLRRDHTAPRLGERGTWRWLARGPTGQSVDEVAGRHIKLWRPKWLLTILGWVGLLPPKDPNSPPSLPRRFATTPRFVKWFL